MYSFQSRVKYSETDKDGYLSLEGMMNYFQDCSALHSEDLGVGIEYQRKNHFTWMIILWHVQILKRPKYCEEITVGTWPYSFKSIKGGRHFVILDKDGNTLVRADSEWVIVDLDENRLKKIPKELSDVYSVSENMEMGEIRQRIQSDTVFSKKDSITVTPFFLDSNHHVNNVKYLSVAEGYVDGEYDEFYAEYKHQAYLHDEICVYKAEETSGSQIVLKNQNDEVLVNLVFQIMESIS